MLHKIANPVPFLKLSKLKYTKISKIFHTSHCSHRCGKNDSLTTCKQFITMLNYDELCFRSRKQLFLSLLEVLKDYHLIAIEGKSEFMAVYGGDNLPFFNHVILTRFFSEFTLVLLPVNIFEMVGDMIR